MYKSAHYSLPPSPVCKKDQSIDKIKITQEIHWQTEKREELQKSTKILHQCNVLNVWVIFILLSVGYTSPIDLKFCISFKLYILYQRNMLIGMQL